MLPASPSRYTAPASSALRDGVRKHYPWPLKATTGMQRQPGVQVRPRAESPKAARRPHLNPGFKVVSHASPWRRMYFQWRQPVEARVRKARASCVPGPWRHERRGRRRPRRAAPRIARAPPRDPGRAADRRRRGARGADPRLAVPARRRRRRRVLGDGRRDRAARAATAIAGRTALLPAGTGRRRSVALRALVARRPLGDQPARHSGAGRPRFRTARTGSDVARGGPAGRLRRARPPARHGRGLVRSQLRVPQCARCAASTVAGRGRVPRAAGRIARGRAVGRAAGRGVHRARDPDDGPSMTPRKRYWLMKSEPGDFSIDDLRRVGTEPWTGVRNYQARNFMRQMQVGDGVLFYHSNCEVPGVYGLARVASPPYPDPTQFQRKSKYFDEKATREQPRWDLVDVAYDRHLARAIPLDEIRGHADALGEDFALIRKGSRLSVMPVTAAQWKLIVSLEHA